MAARYTAAEKKAAKDSGQKLATIDAGGLEFSGLVTTKEQREIAEFMIPFAKRREERLEAEADKA